MGEFPPHYDVNVFRREKKVTKEGVCEGAGRLVNFLILSLLDPQQL